MSFLASILEHKKAEVELRKRTLPLSALQGEAAYSRTPLSLASALHKRDIAVIAEIKKASPSRGVIREEFDPSELARQYVAGGASALSVLTDVRFFQGDPSFITLIRPLVRIPILRKDFILDPYQIHEAKAVGADALLLIAAALRPERLLALKEEAEALGMECLVEVHNESELASLPLDRIALLGINNRYLATFETDLSTSVRLCRLVPPSTLIVSESGIANAQDFGRLSAAGIHAVLIGEQFMRSPHAGEALARFLAEVRP